MRILVAADSWFPDARGGSGRVAAETSRRLAARGHEVTVLAPVKPGSPAVETDGGLTVLRRLGRGHLPQTLSDPVYSWRWARRVAGPFDVLVAHQMTVASGLAAALGQVPLVVVYHASPVREALLRSERRDSRHRRWSDRAIASTLRQLELIATRGASRTLVLSDYSRSLFVHDHPLAGKRVSVVRGGVDTSTFRPGAGAENVRASLGIDEGETLLVSIRRLEPTLGVETVVRAFERVARRRSARLAMIGDGSYARRLREVARELGVDGRVRFVGAPDEHELPLWYRAADLFVLAPAPHEGFGMATIEALASGTPVIAAPVGANPELLGPLEPRLLARSASPEDLAVAIADALELTGPAFRRRCREYAEARFDWDHVIQDWERELVDVVRSHT